MKLRSLILMLAAATALAVTSCDSLTGDGENSTPKGGCGSHSSGTTPTTTTTDTTSGT